MSRGRRVTRAAGLVAGYAVVFTILASGWVPCSFATLTHQPCPGCGTTRAALALFHGDFATAFRFNPLGPFVIAALAVLAGDALRLVARDGDLRAFADSKVAAWALKIVLGASVLQLVVWVLRFFGYLGGPVPVG
jgi:hypothetical protein